ncbi:MAG: BamA/TamA family outer membrane protein [Bacteroides sp.]|nr:BamA/TamA family outer membrane protein [Bacteroides sp.]
MSKLCCLLTPLLSLGSCVSSRHVPEGSYLLDQVHVEIDDSTKTFDTQEMSTYIRQLPNHKMLWSMKFRLGVYNMSGNDTTKWYNKWVRKLGEAPVVYDSTLMALSSEQLTKAMVNKGFLNAEVETDTVVDAKKRKIKVNYRLTPGTPHIINTVNYVFPDEEFENLVMSDSGRFIVKPGNLLDRTLLETQREIITERLRNRGYYGFSKEFITFNADTTEGSNLVDLTMTLNPPSTENAERVIQTHDKYIVRDVYFLTDYDPGKDISLRSLPVNDTVRYKGLNILYGEKHYLRPEVLYENCFIRPGHDYIQNEVDRTYQALSRFSILKFINIRFLPVGNLGDEGLLDAYVLLTPGKSQSMSLEVEGTNSEGDLGVAAAATYTHRNIGKGSETLTAKVRGAYESLSGNLEGLLHNRYMEYSFDLGVNFPKFKAPFLSERFKRRINATTELNASMTYQERPEYTRIISTAGWSYKWTHHRNHNRYVFTPIDINYVYLPESTYNFIDQIAPDNPLLRYSYEDHFIMRLGFSFYHSNKKQDAPWRTTFQRNIYTIRSNVEFAGNLLYLISNIFAHRDDVRNNPYKIFGIHYSQYFKINSDFSFMHVIDNRNSLAFHVGLGVGYPYGNSSILPFEKRFYGGGANGVRGWDVRTLGPGKYPGTNSVSDFINQCGDIRFDLSAEYRTKLFWILELAAFVDGGNIWTIHNYPNQPGGMFHFNSFYKELAAAYGLGLRLDFSYFLLRFDLGMKAHNPAMGQIAWPLIHPRWKRDSSFHFSIGYPF